LQSDQKNSFERRVKRHSNRTASHAGLGAVSLLLSSAAIVLLCTSPAPWRYSDRPLRVSAGSLHFAIADWDGDQKPDLAFVEAERQEAATGHYSIRLQFGAGTESTITLDAPSGGLRLTARDVNGDDKVDLIVTSEFGTHVIEVLLNDGHGEFTVADLGAYEALAAGTTCCLRTRVQAFTEQISLGQFRLSFDGEEMGRCSNAEPPPASSGTSLETDVPPTGPRRVRPGRAPPLGLAFS